MPTSTWQNHFDPGILYASNRAPFQYPIRRLILRSREVSKPRDWEFKSSHCFAIWQARRQRCCQGACQIAERPGNSKYKSRGLETFTMRRYFDSISLHCRKQRWGHRRCLDQSDYDESMFIYLCKYVHMIHKNIEKHTAHTIVSWPSPKQWVIVHTSDLMMIIRQSIYILSIITREMGKLITHSPTYCIMDNWENMLNLTHTLDKIYLTDIFIYTIRTYIHTVPI